jgi:hypothetical protein
MMTGSGHGFVFAVEGWSDAILRDDLDHGILVSVEPPSPVVGSRVGGNVLFLAETASTANSYIRLRRSTGSPF